MENKWRMTSMEDNLDGRQPQWKTTSMEDNHNGILNQCKITSMEDDNISLPSKPILFWAWPSSAPACMFFYYMRVICTQTKIEIPLEKKLTSKLIVPHFVLDFAKFYLAFLL